MWVANEFDNTVTRIDPTSLATSTIDVGVGPEGIAVTSGAVWVADNLDLTVSRIDVGHANTVTKVETGDSPTAVIEFAGAIWASNAGDATLSRLDASNRPSDQDLPLRQLSDRPGRGRVDAVGQQQGVRRRRRTAAAR